MFIYFLCQTVCAEKALMHYFTCSLSISLQNSQILIHDQCHRAIGECCIAYFRCQVMIGLNSIKYLSGLVHKHWELSTGTSGIFLTKSTIIAAHLGGFRFSFKLIRGKKYELHYVYHYFHICVAHDYSSDLCACFALLSVTPSLSNFISTPAIQRGHNKFFA